MSRKREYWVDLVKVIACVLIVLGHFYQSMVKSGILQDTVFYQWFITAIYCFHTELFFVCSGYLYQRYSHINDWSSWQKNILRKAKALGIPYLVFSVLAWLLKTVFAGSVNTKAGGLLYTLFVYPIPPYWLLYILFLCFLVTPTVSSADEKYIFFGTAFVLKLVQIVFNGHGIFSNYIVTLFGAYWFWFVAGMILAATELKKLRTKERGFSLLAEFFILSLMTFRFCDDWISFLLGLIAVAGVILIAMDVKENKYVTWFAGYSFPILLMHTLFAAPVRVLLLKIGISFPLIHIIIGLAASFVLPIVTMRILEKAGLDFIIW